MCFSHLGAKYLFMPKSVISRIFAKFRIFRRNSAKKPGLARESFHFLAKSLFFSLFRKNGRCLNGHLHAEFSIQFKGLRDFWACFTQGRKSPANASVSLPAIPFISRATSRSYRFQLSRFEQVRFVSFTVESSGGNFS